MATFIHFQVPQTGVLLENINIKDLKNIKDLTSAILSWMDFVYNNQLFFPGDSNGLERYFLYTQNMSWRDAQLYCRQNHTDLVSVKTKQQNVEIQDQAKGNTIWIGLIREGWMWSDGSQTSFRNWDESSPDNGGGAQNCVAILKSLQHQWDDSTCDVSYPFFCQGGKLFKIKKPNKLIFPKMWNCSFR